MKQNYIERLPDGTERLHFNWIDLYGIQPQAELKQIYKEQRAGTFSYWPYRHIVEIRTCPTCKAEFYYPGGRLKTYCSRACRRKAQNTRYKLKRLSSTTIKTTP